MDEMRNQQMEYKEKIEGKEHFHGSDLEKIERYFGIPKESITGFGANVNPLGISPRMRRELAEKIDVVASYPDPEYTELRKHIAAYTRCLAEQVIVGNGCTELISLFIQVLKPREALIVSPTYSEYEREVRLSGGTVRYYALKEQNGFRLEPEDFIWRRDLSCHYLQPQQSHLHRHRARRHARCTLQVPGPGNLRHDRRDLRRICAGGHEHLFHRTSECI
jgi:hypothetical protein